ncbi:hypothetical protein Dda_8356 [Drechslerella dactyloides]|uniref:Carboxypeptidase n=1 Tax=Drechslerella dactyloides TaxID=74499 RepID=A0AAD6NFR6_DREDA|nr:hypothetical protein Dda_8356 [Drechslerella dactyloides]
MKLTTALLLATAALAEASRSPQAIHQLYSKFRARATESSAADLMRASLARRTPPTNDKKFKYLNRSTKEFFVNGTAGSIPDVHFDLPESYAGLLPISKDKDEPRQLYFWFWPSTGGPETQDDIVIWLNGGPGCSSLEGFLQENGPFSWKYGTYLPQPNKYSWTNLTNMIWIEQPVGTGFSRGEPNIKNEEDLAKQLLGFFNNFTNKFNLHNKRIWLTGESYAGKFIPYIADAMYAAKDKRNFDIRGAMMYDPSIDDDVIMQRAPAVSYLLRNKEIFNLPDEKVAAFEKSAADCGLPELYAAGLTYPPAGPIKKPTQSCGNDIWEDIFEAAIATNPCFNIYHITDTCPLLWDVLGFPGSFGYLPEGAQIYFARPEVQRAINAPAIKWEECSERDVFPSGDGSGFPIPAGVMSRIIERNERTIIAHGLHDYILLADGSKIAIQNMTWGGKQGFQTAPSKKFVVPYEGQGELGTWHEERGLTYIEIKQAGHMVPQYQPGAGYRHLEYLLGRVKDLSA